MLFVVWLTNHLLLASISWIRYGSALLIGASLLQFFVYLTKDPSYDLLVYIQNINNSDYYYEPVSNFFLYLIELLSFGSTWLCTALITGLLLALHSFGLASLLVESPKRYFGHNQQLLAICVVLSSLYFFLGSQNVLRQSLSIGLFILFISYHLKRNHLISVFFLALSGFSHYGNLPIILLMTVYLLFTPNLTGVKSFLIGLFLGMLGVLALKLLDFSTDYLVTDFSISEERTSLLLKWLFVSMVVFLTTYLIDSKGGGALRTINWVLGLRCLLIGLLTSIFIFDFNEMFSRIAVNLYALDMILLFLLIGFDFSLKNKSKFAILILICSPALAPNVFQILKGL